MRFVMYNDFQPGLLVKDTVLDISPIVRDLPRYTPHVLLQGIITNFDRLRPRLEELQRSGKGVPVASVRLRSPLPRPGKMMCCIGNYKEGTQREPRPIDMFLKSPEAVVGAGDTVRLPAYSATIFHHEAELGVVIGRQAKDLRQAEAMDAVFGYTCFIDVSARGVGRTTQGAGSFIGKSYDTFAPIGPALVTKDEIPDPYSLGVRFWVNGELRQDYSTADMEHRIPEVLEFASSVSTLFPGDLIACGTNHQGLGALQDGDEAAIEIERVGRMSVKVADPLKRTWTRGVDLETARRLRTGEGGPMGRGPTGTGDAPRNP
ncbi:MAG: fumarylacetoacetate hydrolase family protein [Chloroflexi bacterium]|nr:fumarylacetoacetate hydrolase family protein [Chloroflexota bacterium]